jgi:hypothetical protein
MFLFTSIQGANVVDGRTYDFAEFWYRFPRRVGKLAAEAAYKKALKLATHEDIMAGVERYIKAKPSYADWCHPRTFLAQGRWMDELTPELSAAKYEAWQCPHQPPCPHRAACLIVSLRRQRTA